MQETQRRGFDPRVGKIPWSMKWEPTPGFLPGNFHAQRSLEGYSPRGGEASDRTKWLSTAQHSSLSCVCALLAEALWNCFSCVTETLEPWNSNSGFPLLSCWQPPSYFLLYKEVPDHFTHLISGESGVIYFCDWIILFSIRSSRFIPVVACDKFSLFFKAE